ncbi:hypothetical protein CDL12_21214 [Handroanthus impetiginosus]|uniref:Uncharacterized protein n=1 Tax=Handroanthus impetiginosus TaxID=429701 RepID=A0A2G9GLT8_9LAMI|nr:hypothetical protein CDL12_21214 [Handroanthus impetiginosus]
MMNKKRLSISPLNSPTIDGMEMQPNTSPANTQNATAPSPADPTTTGGRLKTSIHVTALDGIVNVNSLFTMALFIGFSLTVPEATTAASRPECTTSRETVRRLIVFEVLNPSNWPSTCLKTWIRPGDPHKADIDPDYLKYGLFGSAIGSVVGCSFLMLSIVDFIQVKLGTYTCGGKPVYAVVTLVVFVGFGLAVYVSTAVYASFFVEISSKDTTTPQKQKS